MKTLAPLLLGNDIPILNHDIISAEEAFELAGNSGNLLFRSAIYKHIGRQYPQVKYGKLIKYPKSSDNLIVIPCANHLGKNSASFGANRLKNFKGIKSPMIAIGLGAQADDKHKMPQVPSDVIEWLKIIINNAPSNYPNISVRGSFTQEVLNNLGFENKSIVLGCPSLFINDATNLGSIIERNMKIWPPKRIAVSCGQPLKPKYEKIEAALAKLVNQYNGAYIVQHPLTMIQLAKGEFSQVDKNIIEKTNKVLVPNLNQDEFFDWCKKHMRVFFDIDAWMEYLRGFDFVFGTRIHGTMIALQAGVPAVCLTHDSRTKEMCETMKIPHIDMHQLDLENLSLEDILKQFSFDPREFDENRKSLARKYVHFLNENKAPVYDGLVNIAK